MKVSHHGIIATFHLKYGPSSNQFVHFPAEEVKGTMTDIIVKIIEDDPSQYQEGIESQEQILKDCGMSLPEIKAYIASNLPPPPTPPEELERRRQMSEELERLQKAEEERERLAKLKETDPEAYEREVNPKAGCNIEMLLSLIMYTYKIFCHLVNYHALKAIFNAGCGSHQSTQHLTL